MDLGLHNKRALVTAASRGLGLASARALAAEGARVAMAARSTSSLTREAEALARSNNTEMLPLTMDLCDPSSIARGVDEVITPVGGVDILITSTSGPIAGEFVTISRESWQTALNMVVLPVIDLLHHVIPSMRANGGGRILCITTIGVKTLQPGMVLSTATRLAITGFAKTLSFELAHDNILVNTLCPGLTDTDRMVNLVELTQKEKGISREAADGWIFAIPPSVRNDMKDKLLQMGDEEIDAEIARLNRKVD